MNGNRGYQVQSVMPLTPVVKWLIIINVSVWLILQLIIERFFLKDQLITGVLGLIPYSVLTQFFIWQVGTYMFLHSYAVAHIVMNMLMLWWLGSELEQRWGSRFFLAYYLASGIGAAILYLIALVTWAAFTGSTTGWMAPVVGASGGIFGLLLAYGLLFGERIVYFFMVFPMKARYFVMILAAMELATLVGGENEGVATLAHLGGLVSGFLFLTLYTRFQQRRWRKQGAKRGRGLRLVVNNDRKTDEKDGPKYWN